MKTTGVTGTAHVGMALYARAAYLRCAAQCVAINTDPLRLQRALAQVNGIERALAPRHMK